MAKIELQDFVYYGKLLEIYGNLLSRDRQEIMTMYFQYNNTLAEIAQQRGISRQAVLDAVDKSCQKLRDFEAKLKISAKNEELAKSLDQILCLIKNTGDKEIIQKIEQLIGRF